MILVLAHTTPNYVIGTLAMDIKCTTSEAGEWAEEQDEKEVEAGQSGVEQRFSHEQQHEAKDCHHGEPAWHSHQG